MVICILSDYDIVSSINVLQKTLCSLYLKYIGILISYIFATCFFFLFYPILKFKVPIQKKLERLSPPKLNNLPNIILVNEY